jgi:hypothetical protein
MALRTAMRARPRERNVMAIEREAKGRQQLATQSVEVPGRNLERCFTYLTGQMAMRGTRQVVHGGLLSKVRVDDDAEIFEFFEDPVHRRRADLGAAFLHRDGDLVSREVAASTYEHFSDDSLGDRDSLRRTAHHVQNGLLVVGSRHKPRLGPRSGRFGRRGSRGDDYNVASRVSISSASRAMRRTISLAGSSSLMAPTA